MMGLLFLVACTNDNDANSRDSKAEAVLQGRIMSIETALGDVARPDISIVMAGLGNIDHTINLSASMVFPVQYPMYLRRSEGDFTLHVDPGQYVNEGDILAHLSYENESMEINLAEARWRLEEFDRETLTLELARQMELEAARQALDSVDDANWVQQALRLQQLELSYERFQIDRINARDRLVQNLTNLDELLAGEYLIAPANGMVLSTLRTDVLRGNPRILTLVDSQNFFFGVSVVAQHLRTLPISHSTIIRYGSIIPIRSQATDSETGEPILQFYARVVSDPWGAGHRINLDFLLVPADMESFLEALYKLDPYNPMYKLTQLTLIATVSITMVENSVLLPISAINPEDYRSFVYVYEYGRLSKRYVLIGISFAGYVHIIDGVEPGTQVVILP